MTQSIATLGIAVKTDGIQQAERQLDSLAKTGAKVEQQTAKVAPAMQSAAKSAKELQFATRNLPAQFTDIATSLGSGQRPLQVLLQQGGQIKDMFGGIGPAFRAVGAAVAGMITPFTVAAAAAGALFLAWKQGNDEAVEFRQALALTGDAAGVTANQMQAMAFAISQSVGTQHEAAQALAEVARTGKFTGDQLRDVAEAAVALSHATGQSIDDTVRQFAKLGDDPVRAIEQLNDTYHFLTLATYEQIRALQEQGREEDAVSLAIRTASAELSKRASDVVSNASYMERAWRSLGSVVRQVWDDIRNAGRASTAITQAQMQVASANSELNALANRTRVAISNGRKFTADEVEGIHRETARLVKLKQDAARAIADDPGTRAAASRAAQQRAQEDAIEFRQRAEASRTGLDKLKAERVKKQGEADTAYANAIRAGAGEAAKAIRDASTIELAAIDKQIAEQEKRGAPRAAGGARARSNAVRAMPDFNKRAAEEAARLAQEEQRATDAFLDMQAVLEGPLAVATREHNKRVEEMNALAAQSPVAAEGLTRALELEEQAFRKAADEIKRQQDPLRLLIEDLQFELDTIGKSNAERAVMIELRRQNKDAASAEGQAALASARAFEQEAERRQGQIDLMDEARDSARGMFTDIYNGANAWDAVKEAFDRFADAVFDFASKKVIEQLFGQMGTSQTGSSGGGFWDMIGQFVGAWAGGAGGGGASAAGGGGQFGWIGAGYADGGLMPANSIARVNERGMEMATVGGKDFLLTGRDPVFITPHHLLGAQRRSSGDDARGGRGDSVVVHQTINVPHTPDYRTSNQIASESARRLAQATRYS